MILQNQEKKNGRDFRRKPKPGGNPKKIAENAHLKLKPA